MTTLLDFSQAPDDPIERLMWLSGVKEAVAAELDQQYERSYFWARMTHRLAEAEALGYHGHKRIMAYTRAGNFHIGTTVRWNDGH